MLMHGIYRKLYGTACASIGNYNGNAQASIGNYAVTDVLLVCMFQMTALDSDTGRQEVDPGYQLVAKALYGQQRDRNKHRLTDKVDLL